MNNQIVPRTGGGAMRPLSSRLPKRVERELAEVEAATALRLALVQGEAISAAEKLSTVDYLAWKAVTGHAQLAGLINNLAGEDPVLAIELRFFLDSSRLAKASITNDAIDNLRGI